MEGLGITFTTPSHKEGIESFLPPLVAQIVTSLDLGASS